ncbi:flagellar motor protein MotB [Paracoccus sp. WLY502]|uniref:flagellar motor protein MotB n=1 Tax=Paracoccus yibinensis TaxID=3068891 RepID=UPI0027966493|nr:flagellar motor protein MotB [Paracoccus sp. WLY502]MDQ1900415.1 flagellar motor protein MotB [Paracoccus sp. WLY502]
MARQKGAAGPTIMIKRVTASGDGGHHGGAWKVAYADFVTAMMAFFLLMWLLNATTEQQRSGLADYFNPTIVRTPGASGEGVEQQGKEPSDVTLEQVAEEIERQLRASGGESQQLTNLLRHVVTRMTDEGLVIELGDLTDQPLFVEDSGQPQPVLTELTRIIGRVLTKTRNQIAISGHVRAYPETLVDSPVWPLSDARAHAVRGLLEGSDLDAQRIQRVTGYADRKNKTGNPMDPTNNRIEVILLR